MRIRILPEKFVLFAALALLFSSGAVSASAQKPPTQEKLLNGLRILAWNDPKADKVNLRLRIHAGSAFDPQGKEGVMQILADNLFPNPASREFFAEDLGGSLDVVATYDYIEINASSKPESVLTVIETIATAVSNLSIDKEVIAKLRTALAERVAAAEADPAYVADRAVARRLFATFPYGRPQIGSRTSVASITFADVIDAEQRFLSADNATLAISGNFDRSNTLRAVRRLFGSWIKSDKRVPSTFRQPDDPPTAVEWIPSPKPETAAIRFAVRGVSRADKDLAGSMVFASILENRLKARVPAEHSGSVFVRNEYHLLPGSIIVGFSASKNDIGNANGKIEATDLISKALNDPISETEFNAGLAAARAAWSKVDPVTVWLDADTFRTAGADADQKAINSVSIGDVRSFADKIRSRPIATVVVNSPVSK